MKNLNLTIVLILLMTWNGAWGQVNLPPVKGEKKHLKSEMAIEGSFPQTIERFTWDDEQWAPEFTRTVTYTSWGELETEIMDYQYEDRPNQKRTFTYDDRQYEIMVLTQIGSEDAWVDDSRIRTEYDALGFVTLETSEVMEGGSWVIVDQFKYEYVFDGENPTVITDFEYDVELQTFFPVYRMTYEYTQGGLSAVSISEYYEDGAWVKDSRMTYFWGASNQMDYALIDAWEESEWVPSGKYEWTYYDDESNDMTLYLYEPESSSYIPYMRIVTRYDSHLNMILDTIEMFVVDEWVMMSGVRMDITYEGNRAVQQIQQASFNGGPWENVMKEVYKNFINLGMEDPLNLSLRLTCYPNPAGDEVILDYSALSSSVWKIEVINLNGKPVRVLNPELPAGRVTLDIQDLPAGFYIIRMIDKMGRTETRQLIKQQ